MAVLSDNAKRQFEKLYSFQNETIEETFRRVANEFGYTKEEHELAYSLLDNNIWRPNTPVFLNAGTKHKVFSACYVAGLEDSMESIFDVSNTARKIFQFGSGIGIPVGNLREKNAFIYEGDKETPPEGQSSGPITFMKLFDAVGDVTKSGGRVRRAAILCNLPIWHPDIMEFIQCKKVDGWLSNMNISVNVTDKFMSALKDKIPFDLHTPYDGSKVGTIDPQELWDSLVEMSWETADPGIIFIDKVNEMNPLIKKHLIEVSNPCGEQFLKSWGACNLSSINVSKFVVNGEYDWKQLYNTAFDVMGLMDNIINVMEFPEECSSDKKTNDRFRDTVEKFRPVGIGIMGLADALYNLNIAYDSNDGRSIAGKIMKTITTACVHKSALLAEKNGAFHNYKTFKSDMERIISKTIGADEPDFEYQNVLDLVKKHGVRNCQFTTAPPTGTTALSCDASYGIEPIFGLTFVKHYVTGTEGTEEATFVNEIFHNKFKNEKWFNKNLIERIYRNNGSLKGIHGIPKDVREAFCVAHDIKFTDRIDMQAELQKYCSNAISSTVNLSQNISKKDVDKLYRYAYEKGLKGITIYRDGSKKNQPVTFTPEKVEETYTRPSKLSSITYKMDTGNGRMYITVADYKGAPLEVFINVGKSGQILNTFSEALSRVISIALQQGVPMEEISKTLIGINSDKPTWFRFEETDKKPTQILSIPDGIAKLLSRYYAGTRYEGDLSGELCPKCGLSMVAIEGCFSCTCGHSNCS